jgi:phosphonopyruvate decarboxylase
MISSKFFIDTLNSHGIHFFAGVPDSLLKSVCAYLSDQLDEKHHIIAANEGGAIGMAAGYHLATGKIGCVYLQNSGEGNIINPLASLTDREVYNIPVLLLIGWRGRPGVHDEPQHIKQGKVTTDLLDTMGVAYSILSKCEDDASRQIAQAVDYMKETNGVYALVIEKDTFDPYTSKLGRNDKSALSREEAIQTVASSIDEKDVIVSTTGMISRELFEYRVQNGEGHERDFLTVGSMGHASQIALGIALNKNDRRIWCFDGDGAAIMHLGGMAIVASEAPKNYIHVLFNNGAHDSVGGQPTVGLDINFCAIAKAVGYTASFITADRDGLIRILNDVKKMDGPVLIVVCVKKGNRRDLGRPTTTPIQNKEALMAFLSD